MDERPSYEFVGDFFPPTNYYHLTRFYDEFMPFWDPDIIEGQRVIYTVLGCPLLVHPMLVPLLEKAGRGKAWPRKRWRERTGDPNAKMPAVIIAGKSTMLRPLNMVDYGLGFRVYDPGTILWRRKFSKLGLVEVAHGVWIVPKWMIQDWIMCGKFVVDYSHTEIDPKFTKALKETPGMESLGKKLEAMNKGKRLPVGKKSKPLAGGVDRTLRRKNVP